MPTDFILRSSAAALYLKLIIDIWRYYNKRANIVLPGWFTAMMAVIMGVILSMLLSIANGTLMTPQTLSEAILSGILSAAQAIGVTEMQKKV
jgi:membrane-associated HD superfamily phosphohydrolase